jgi:uncharacterized membrane protein
VTISFQPIAIGAAIAAYPFLSAWLIDHGLGRLVLLLFAALTLHRFVRAGSRFQRVVYGGAVVFLALGVFAAEAVMFRLIPALVYLSLTGLFGYTLAYPPTLLERMVRLQFPEFKPGIAEYLRQLTWLWTGFFAANVLICVWLAFLAGERVWMLYTGVVVYALMGLLVVVEMIYRSRRFPDLEMPKVMESLKIMLRDGHKVFRDLRG